MPFTHPTEVRQTAVELVRSGLRPVDAAARVGVSTSAVYSWLHADAPQLVSRPGPCFRCVPGTGTPPDQAAYAHLLGLYLGDGYVRRHRPIALQTWQLAVVEAHPGRLLRGLFHSDGWRGTNVAAHRRGGQVVRYRYARYEFTNRSEDIRRLCTDALDGLDIAWRPNGRWRISVARRDAVAALDRHVGPKA